MLTVYLILAIVIIITGAFLMIKALMASKKKDQAEIKALKEIVQQKEQYAEFLVKEASLLKAQKEALEKEKATYATQMNTINQSKTKEEKDAKVSNTVAGFYGRN
jgi:predicted Holliday junction resolvase-like endonuclease